MEYLPDLKTVDAIFGRVALNAQYHDMVDCKNIKGDGQTQFEEALGESAPYCKFRWGDTFDGDICNLDMKYKRVIDLSARTEKELDELVEESGKLAIRLYHDCLGSYKFRCIEGDIEKQIESLYPGYQY
jgi:hypothetical protein